MKCDWPDCKDTAEHIAKVRLEKDERSIEMGFCLEHTSTYDGNLPQIYDSLVWRLA